MRVVLDTNILVSSLLIRTSTPAFLSQQWLRGRFTLLCCQTQLLELHSTLDKSHIATRLQSNEVGRLFNRLRRRAVFIDVLPHVRRSYDPNDDFLLALAEAGRADYLVSGDKSGLLALHKHAGARIVTAREFLNQIS